MPGDGSFPDGGGWACRDASRQAETAGPSRVPVFLGMSRRNARWGRVRAVPKGAAIDPRPELRPDGLELGGAILWSTGRSDLVVDRQCAGGGLLHLSVSLVSRQGHPGVRIDPQRRILDNTETDSFVPLRQGAHNSAQCDTTTLAQIAPRAHSGTVSWSLAEDTPKLQRSFRGRFGRALPVSAFGESPLHERMEFPISRARQAQTMAAVARSRGAIDFIASPIRGRAHVVGQAPLQE